MKYMLLIYDDPEVWSKFSEAESRGIMGEYVSYTNDLVQAGQFVAGDALQPTAAATTVRVREGERQTTDGPFAETKEFLSGYYLVEVPSLDEALEWAAKIPSSRVGSIEVRPVMEYPPEMMTQGE